MVPDIWCPGIYTVFAELNCFSIKVQILLDMPRASSCKYLRRYHLQTVLKNSRHLCHRQACVLLP